MTYIFQREGKLTRPQVRLIVAHFRPEIFYWLVQTIRSYSSQKPAIIQFHDQK